MSFFAGAVSVKLTADEKPFVKGVDNAEKKLSKFEQAVEKQQKGIGSSLKNIFEFSAGGMLAGGIETIGSTLQQTFSNATTDAKEYEKAMIGLKIISKSFNVDQDAAVKVADELGKSLKIGPTAASNGLQNLLKSGLGLDKAADLMKRFNNEALTGKSAGVAQAQAIENLTFAYATNNSTIGNLSGINENFTDITERGRDSLIKKGVAMSEITDAAAKYEGMINLTNLTAGSAEKLSGTAIDTEAKKQYAFGETSRVLGEMLLPKMVAMDTALISIFDNTTKVLKFFKEYPEVLTGLSTTFGILAGVLIYAVTPAMVAMAIAGWGMMAPFLPFIAAAIAIGIVVAGLAYLWNRHFDDIKNITIAVFDVIGKTFNWMVDTGGKIWNDVFKSMNDAVTGTNKWISDTFDGMKNYLTDTFNGIKDSAVNTFDSVIKSLTDTFDSVLKSLTETFDSVKKNITDTFNSVVQSLTETFNSAKQSIIETFDSMVAFGTKAFDDIKNLAIGAWQGIKNGIKAAIGGVLYAIDIFKKIVIINFKIILKAITVMWNRNFLGIRTIVTGVFNAIKTAVMAVGAVFAFIGMAIWNHLTKSFYAVRDSFFTIAWAIQDATRFVRDVLITAFNFVKDKVIMAFDAIVKFFTPAFLLIVRVVNTVADAVTAAFNFVKDGAIHIFNQVKDTVITVFNQVKDTLIIVFNQVKDSLILAFNTAKDAIIGAFNFLKDGAIHIFNQIKDGLIFAFNTAKDAVIGAFNFIVAQGTIIFNQIKDTIVGAFNTAKDGAIGAFEAIKTALIPIGDFFNSIFNGITTTSSNSFDWVKNTAIGAFESIKTALIPVGKFFTDIFDGLKNAASSAFNQAKISATNLMNDIKWIFNEMIRKINVIITGINKIIIEVGVGSIPTLPTIPSFRKGVENFGGGMAYVHQGEMLMNLAPGTTVKTAQETESMLSQNQPSIVINVPSGSFVNAQSMDEFFKLARNSAKKQGFAVA